MGAGELRHSHCTLGTGIMAWSLSNVVINFYTLRRFDGGDWLPYSLCQSHAISKQDYHNSQESLFGPKMNYHCMESIEERAMMFAAQHQLFHVVFFKSYVEGFANLTAIFDSSSVDREHFSPSSISLQIGACCFTPGRRCGHFVISILVVISILICFRHSAVMRVESE